MEFDFRSRSEIFITIFILAVFAHLAGLLNDVFISDSALYASIAKEMVLSNNFIDLSYDGVDWLDKPHFFFWITAVSFKIFGINTFAYKLPAILFTFLALFYTYKLAKELYNKETALLAVLILVTAEHLVISNNDVRAEPYLTGLIIASVYHYHRVIRNIDLSALKGSDSASGASGLMPGAGIGNLVLASLFASLAIMTKGVFTLIPILGAVAGELIIKRKWKEIFNWRWVLSVTLIILFILPELYALYMQFDLHPEKLVFGRTGVSGIRFFLWDSQFGRFLNTGPITGKGDPFFFLHTLLWAFLPWSILMYWSVFKKIRRNIPRVNQGEEFYTLSGAMTALLVFSLSGFQLPHYTNIIFPFLAILTAAVIIKLSPGREQRVYAVSQYTLILLMVSLPIVLIFLFRPELNLIFPVLAIIVTALAIAFTLKFRKLAMLRIFLYTCLASILLNFFLNLVFYPRLLQYQSGSRVAEYANTHYPGKQINTLGVLSFTLHFHADAEVKDRRLQDLPDLIMPGNQDSVVLLFASENYLDSLKQIQIRYQILEEFDHYHTTMVTGTFLNHKTRKDALRRHYLLNLRL